MTVRRQEKIHPYGPWVPSNTRTWVEHIDESEAEPWERDIDDGKCAEYVLEGFRDIETQIPGQNEYDLTPNDLDEEKDPRVDWKFEKERRVERVARFIAEHIAVWDSKLANPALEKAARAALRRVRGKFWSTQIKSQKRCKDSEDWSQVLFTKEQAQQIEAEFNKRGVFKASR